LLKGIKEGGKGQFSREEVWVLRVRNLGGDFSRRPRGYLDRLKRHLSLNRMHRLPEGVFLGNPLPVSILPRKRTKFILFSSKGRSIMK
jgi:hypothetical protein